MQALAYTLGSHIVFGEGRYAPHTPDGRRLLTHELAHIVQRDASESTPANGWRMSTPAEPAERAADGAVHAIERNPQAHRAANAGILHDRLRMSAPQQPALLRAVDTWAGKFDTTTYTTVKNAGVEDGVDIELHFKPGDPVDATAIGMAQKVTSKQNGALLAVDLTVGARSLPAGKPGEGAHIDQLKQFRNPLFATGAGRANDQLWSTATSVAWGQHGYHNVDKAGVLHHLDAVLKDTPQLPGHGPNSSQIFETTAMAVTGVQTGAFYGSVQWGWKSDAAGTFTRLPLTKVSGDVPSGTFAAAQALWNKSQDSAGNNLIKFYTASGKFVSTPDTPLVGDPKDAAGTEIAKLPQNTRLEVINIGFYEAFNKGVADKWWKVTVVEGAGIGKTGWVKSSQLSGKKT